MKLKYYQTHLINNFYHPTLTSKTTFELNVTVTYYTIVYEHETSNIFFFLHYSFMITLLFKK